MTEPEQRRRPDERILVLVPGGRNAEVTQSVLSQAGLGSEICSGVEDLLERLTEGGAAILLGEDALSRRAVQALEEALRSQPSWSEVPLVLLVPRGSANVSRVRALRRLQSGGNLTVLERPVLPITLQTVALASVRARQRQYETRDLLERLQQTTKELEAERGRREQFVSVLAHDLRGPLTAASLGAELLQRALDGSQRTLAARISRSVDHAVRMVRDLLDTQQMVAAERVPLQLGPCDLEQIVRDVVDGLEQGAERVRVRRVGEPPRGVWDGSKVQRAV